jgi:CheY-like chemotaxis protein
LGLTIVKNLVELQGGSISLNSTEGYGSTFQINLPLEKADREIVLARDQDTTDLDALHLLKRASILVVEDNHVNQLLVKRVLDKTGCSTDVVSNGLLAIERIKTGKYDLILMDIQMPEMDGYAATKLIRTNLPAPLNEIPIIAMTAHALPSEVEKCISLGMNDYVSKPFKQEVLYSKIIKHLKRSNHVGIIPLYKTPMPLETASQIDISSLDQVTEGDEDFANDLVRMYEKQTPDFVEKLRSGINDYDPETISSICHQIKSSYGIVALPELKKVLDEVSVVIKRNKREEFPRLTTLVNVVVSLILSITEELKRSIRKTG